MGISKRGSSSGLGTTLRRYGLARRRTLKLSDPSAARAAPGHCPIDRTIVPQDYRARSLAMDRSLDNQREAPVVKAQFIDVALASKRDRIGGRHDTRSKSHKAQARCMRTRCMNRTLDSIADAFVRHSQPQSVAKAIAIGTFKSTVGARSPPVLWRSLWTHGRRSV